MNEWKGKLTLNSAKPQNLIANSQWGNNHVIIFMYSDKLHKFTIIHAFSEGKQVLKIMKKRLGYIHKFAQKNMMATWLTWL